MTPAKPLDERLQRLQATWERTASPDARAARKRDCAHPRYVLIERIHPNGAHGYYRACALCGKRDRDGYWMPHEHVDTDQVEQVEDYRTVNPPCQVCGAWGTELHHWAPKAIFGESANHWPTAWLCVGCHTWWHNAITVAAEDARL